MNATMEKGKVLALACNQAGDGFLVKKITGSYGGNSCWDASHKLNVMRGDVKIIDRTETVNDETRVESLLIPQSPFAVVEELNYYGEMNGRRDESVRYHIFTLSSGWREVKVEL